MWKEGPMWVFFVLVGLPSLSSRTPLAALRLPAPSDNGSSPEPQSLSSPSPALPVTPMTLSPRSEAPALSLNLGLNFKIKVRSQGKGPVGEGPRGATADPGLPPAHSQAPGSRLWAEALGGSGWLGPGLAEELPSGPGGWTWEGSPGPAEPHLLASSPTAQPPLTLWPRLIRKGLAVPAVAGEDSRELEFKIDIDLTAGMGKEVGLAPNGSGPGRPLPLLPGLRVGIAELAGKLREAPDLLGSRIPPVTREAPDWNATESTWEPPKGALEPGPESSSPAASPGSGGAFVALPGCPPDRPEDCGSPLLLLPTPGAPALASLLAPGLALPVPLPSDWGRARAAWGPAWEAHVYGAGALFALQALLALLGLALLPCRCPPGGRLLAPMQLLLAGAGAARALLLLVLLGEACGPTGPWPPLAARLLHELPLPCMTAALALACLLLLARRGPAPRHTAAWLLPLLGLHFAAAAGAVLAADRLPQAPFLLLAARGLFALLAAPLSAALLAACCLARPAAAAPKDTACPGPPAAPRCCRRAAALPAALGGLLSAALHAYGLLHALGYGVRAELLGPWPWWALQLAARLCEAAVGLPLAALSLCALGAAPSAPCCGCCGACLSAERVAAKAQSLPRHFPWALAQPEKLALGEARGPADYLPLCALPPDGAPSLLSLSLEGGDAAADPTADFRPPSPIDLRRSIDEALCSEGLLSGSGRAGSFSAASTLSLRLARAPSSDSHLFRTASCVELVAAEPSPHAAAATSSPERRRGSAAAAASPDAPSPAGSASSPERWRGSAAAAAAGSPDGLRPAGSTASARPEARSPPPPGRQFWALPPASQESLASVGRQRGGGGGGAEAALLQEEFLDVCRQIDALSVCSDTIDL
ncbi:proline-rich transmembrane protein 4 [Paroedura picta]|uniref:proline-rich transmembrane protein 4 n=1 Tax=Paroedura picta TaxID=143630 RepID=UPI004056118A